MIYVNKNWFNPDTMGCFGGKYYRNMNSTDFYDLKCDDKRDLSILWEQDIDKDIGDWANLYACLNTGCKKTFGKWVEQKMASMIVICFLYALIILLAIYISYELWRKLSNNSSRVMFHNKVMESGFIFVFFVIIIIGVFVSIFARPYGPHIYEYY